MTKQLLVNGRPYTLVSFRVWERGNFSATLRGAKGAIRYLDQNVHTGAVFVTRNSGRNVRFELVESLEVV